MGSPDSTPHHSATWPLDKIQKLVELWREHTAGQIGAILGLTRNAVISKANRMHLEPKSAKAAKIRAARFEPKPAPPKPEPAAPIGAPVSLGLTLYELEPTQCHYPEGDGPFLFCGAPVKSGSRYCAFHHRLCYFPLSPARRELARPLSDWRGARYG